MIYAFLAITFFTAMGIVLSRYELNRTRRERLRQRARRCVRQS